MSTKKKIIIAVSAITVLILIVLAAGIPLGWYYKVNGRLKAEMNELNAMNTVVYYNGKLKPGKEITLDCKKVNQFTDETIGDLDNKYGYHAIVIFDFDGKMDISDEELCLIKEYCEKKYYDMYYYGTAHLEQFKNCGFFKTGLDKSEYGFTYNGSYWKNAEEENIEEWANPYLVTGIWSKEDSRNFNTNNKNIVWEQFIGYMTLFAREYRG